MKHGKNQRRKTKNSNLRIFHFPFSIFRYFSPCPAVLILCFSFVVFAQDLPDEIRGYKVYKAKISVGGETGKTKPKEAEAVVKLGDPQPLDVSLSGVRFEISAEISALRQSGKIDFITFDNFRVNDLPVEIEEYTASFEVSKNKSIRLPKPVEIAVGFGQTLRGVWQERRDSKEFWQVTGRIFVFGHFKKGFLKFKRVIPVDVNLQIKNPLKSNQ